MPQFGSHTANGISGAYFVDDKVLIASVVDCNDSAAFAELVNRYQKLVHVTCCGLIPSNADVDDIVQDVFVELFQSLPTFRAESKLSTWLYRIAVNKSLNHLRRKKREQLLQKFNFFDGMKDATLEVAAASNYDSDYGVTSSDNRKILRLSISKLPQKQRVVFVLSKYQELSYKEIAEVTGLSLSSVESLLFRAKVNLRKIIAAYI